MKRQILATKWCVQLVSNDTYFSGIWFSGLQTAEELMAEGLDYCGAVRTIHNGFCLAKLENLVEYWPGGSYLVMKSNIRVPGGRPLMTIG